VDGRASLVRKDVAQGGGGGGGEERGERREERGERTWGCFDSPPSICYLLAPRSSSTSTSPTSSSPLRPSSSSCACASIAAPHQAVPIAFSPADATAYVCAPEIPQNGGSELLSAMGSEGPNTGISLLEFIGIRVHCLLEFVRCVIGIRVLGQRYQAGELRILFIGRSMLSTLLLHSPRSVAVRGAAALLALRRILHPTTCSLHTTPCSRHPTPHTRHSTPYTLHPAPYTLRSTP